MRLRKNEIILRVSLLTVALVLIIGPFFMGKYFLNLLTMIFIYSYLAGAWNIMGGYGGLLSFGHSAFLGLGSYAVTLLYVHYKITPWAGMWVGAFLACFTGFTIAWLTFRYRLKGIYFVVATILVAEIFRVIATNVDWTNYAQGIQIPFKLNFLEFQFSAKALYFIAFIMMVGIICLTWYFSKSILGRRLLAIRENEDAAASLGCNLLRIRIIVVCLSAILTSIGGVFHAFFLRMVLPDMDFGLHTGVQLVVYTLAGGSATVFGPLLGTTTLIIFDEILRGIGTSIGIFEMFSASLIVYGIIIMMLIKFLPNGIVGTLGRSKRLRWRDKVEVDVNVLKDTVTKHAIQFIASSEKPILNPGQNILSVHGLCKNFGGLSAITYLNMSIEHGEILGLIGPNGAGKTTLFNIISGFYKTTEGSIKFKHQDLRPLKPHQICDLGIGRTFQIVKPFGRLTVLDNIMVGNFVRIRNTKEAREKAFNIIQFIGLEHKWSRQAQELTLVERKRLELGRALSTEPELLLLDEVMAGLNPKEHDVVIDLIRKIHNYGVTLFIIEHSMKVIMSLSQRIVVLHHGEKIAEGRPKEIQQNPVVIEAYLGKEA